MEYSLFVTLKFGTSFTNDYAGSVGTSVFVVGQSPSLLRRSATSLQMFIMLPVQLQKSKALKKGDVLAERILTLHPEGKKGVNIDKRKYELVRRSILDILAENESFLFKDLTEEVGRRLDPSFEGSVAWYTVSVKLDLEARGLVERIPKKSPQQLRLAEK